MSSGMRQETSPATQYRRAPKSQNVGLLEELVQDVAAGIGLVSESIHHAQQKKRKEKLQQTQKQQEQQHPAREYGSHSEAPEWGVSQADAPPQGEGIVRLSRQIDEAAWDLDDAQVELRQQQDRELRQPQEGSDDPSILAEAFIADHCQGQSNQTQTQLEPAQRSLALPVVLTQRRPQSRARGFIRAYAPQLEEVGVDQAAFLDFVDKLNKSVQPSPWIEALNLAGLAGLALPLPFNMMVSVAVGAVVISASEVQGRLRSNVFLDKVNEEFFKPKGLIALVVTWKPEQADQRLTVVDFEASISGVVERQGADKGRIDKLKRQLRSSNTKSTFEWPETAPLIFPDLAGAEDAEIAAAQASGDTNDGGEPSLSKKPSILTRSSRFVSAYSDKRAQAKWAMENPDSRLATSGPAPSFLSRFADPNHPAASGDVVALLTGGRFSVESAEDRARREEKRLKAEEKKERAAAKKEVKEDRRREKMEAKRQKEREKYGHAPLAALEDGIDRSLNFVDQQLDQILAPGGVTRLLQDDVLYLMVVNRPTQEEVAAATAAYIQAQGQTGIVPQEHDTSV